ncbi:MAG: LamG-like jellyroll fold domain-containing protein, partial [Candidatus Woesearchaeota archaeon]
MIKVHPARLMIAFVLLILLVTIPHTLAEAGENQIGTIAQNNCSPERRPANIIELIQQAQCNNSATSETKKSTEPLLLFIDHQKTKKPARIIKAINADTNKQGPVEQGGNYDIEIGLNDYASISFTRLSVKGETIIGYDAPENPGFRKTIVIDLSGLEFTNAIYTAIAQGYELFKCAEWNFTERICKGKWVKAMDTYPGMQYSIKLTATDPALAEGEGIFFDGFENGFVPNQWTINGTTPRRWTNTTTNPYEGLMHAQATNTDGPTSLTINISTQDYENITISYARRLIGIDTTDEFTAMWYNGTHWITLEATGTGTANDANYIIRNYTLPASANNNTKFRLEFVCNVDLTNEYCRIDNVRVNGTSDDKTPPTIHWTNTSSTTPFVGDSLCLLANVTDQYGVKSVTASIRLPNGTTRTLQLYDGLTCNSVPNDNVFSNYIIPPTEGTYNWTTLNATDKAGNTKQTTTGIIFEGLISMIQITNGTAFPNISRYNNGTIIPPELINTSNNVYATQPLPKNTITYTYFNWTLNISEEIITSNITIEHHYDGTAGMTADLQAKNNTGWQNICYLSISTSDTSDTCNLASFVNGNASKLNNLELRIPVTTGNQNRIQNIDYVTLNYESAPPGTLTKCGDINQSKTLIQNITSATTCIVIGADNVELDCKGNTITYNTGGQWGEGITATNRKNITIKNCIIKDTTTTGESSRGILLENTNDTKIINNTIITNGTSYNHAILIQGPSKNNIITNNTINTQGTQLFNLGIYFTTNPTNNTITQNKITTHGTGSNHAILIQNNAKHNQILNNTIQTTGTNSFNIGIYLLNNASTNTIANNKINTTGTTDNTGILLENNITNNHIENNTIQTKGTQASNEGILLIGPAQNNTITQNKITTNGTTTNHAIQLQNNANTNTITNNTITTGGSANFNVGLIVLSKSVDNLLANNTVSTTGTDSNHGFFITEMSDNTTIAQNTINLQGTSTYSIGIENTTNINIFDNLLGEQPAELHIFNTTDIVLSGDFNNYSITDTYITFRKQGKTELKFNKKITAKGKKLKSDITLYDDGVFVNNSAQEFNVSANITILDINYSDIIIEADFDDDGTFEECPETTCTLIENNQEQKYARIKVEHFTKYKLIPAIVHVLLQSPLNGTEFLLNDTISIAINATASSTRKISKVVINITLPNGTSVELTPTNITKDNHILILANDTILQRGRYNITFFANDTKNVKNTTVKDNFIRKPKNIIDLIAGGQDLSDFTIFINNNISGVLDFNITPAHNIIKQLRVREHHESSPNAIIRISPELNDSIFSSSFSIDLAGLNLTTADLTADGSAGNLLYKCKDWNYTTQECEGEWEKLTDITGQEYTITITAEDPGFGVYNSTQRADEVSTTSTTPVIAVQTNFTPASPQYLLIGYAEVQGNSTTQNVGIQANLNDSIVIGNLSWQPETSRTSNPPGDYLPFFTHNLTTLNTAPQNLSIRHYTSSSTATTYVKNARAIALEIQDQDALTNGTGNAWQVLSPINVFHAITNLTYTPPTTTLALVIASAELLPNSTTEKINSLLNINGNQYGGTTRAGTNANSTALFATHKIINATAGVQQNISLQASSATTANKAIRNARITLVPLETAFFNTSETLSSTTSTSFQTKLNLYFTLDEPSDVLILGSANTSFSTPTNGRFMHVRVLLDGTPISNMTSGVIDIYEVIDFITAHATNLSAGPHTLSMQYRRIGGVSSNTVRIANAILSAIPIKKRIINITNISITKTDWPDPVNKSSNLTYQINISNTGNRTVYNVTVNDTYPQQVIYLTSQPAPLAGTNNTWNWTILNTGTNISINITVLVLNVSNGTIINNTANITFRNITGGYQSTTATTNTTIINRPPSITQVILNTTNPLLNDTYQNLTLYIINATDVDDAVIQNITDWRVNNKSIALLNIPFETNTQSLTTGAIRDYSQYGNNGTLGGGTAANSPVWNNSGKVGGAYQFDGIDDYIQVSGLLGQPASITITAWINWAPNSQDAEGEIISLGDYVALRVSTINYPPWVGAYGFYYDGSTWQATPSSMFLNGTGWHHLAYTFDNNAKVQSIYVDGVLINYTTYSLPISYSGLGSNTIIGRHANGGTTWDFNGTIDEVLVFNRSLSAGQIWQLYVDGNKSIHSMNIASTETITGEVWQACATPNDNQQDGNTVCSNNVTILAPKVYINWTNPSTNETPIYWNTSIRFNTTWTSGTSLSGYIFSINQSGWQNSSFTTFGGLTNESWNITTITADAGSVIGWYFWANNTAGQYNQTAIQNFTVMPRPTALIFSVNQTVYPQGHGDILHTQYNIPLNARFIDVRTGQPISNAYCNVTNNETTDIIELVYSPTTGNYTGNLSTRMLYDNVSLSAECTKKNYATATNTTSTNVWFITYLTENGNKTFDGVGEYTTYLERIMPSGGLYTKTINASLTQGDNLVQEFNYCGSGYTCSLNRGYDVQNGIFSMKLNISINDTTCKPKLCYLFRDPDFNKIYEDCNTTYATIPANTPTLIENNITDTHLLAQGYYLGTSLHLNCSMPVEEQVKIYYNYSGMPASFVITHPKPVEINTFISFSAQLESNYTIGPNSRINETRMATITFNNSMNYPAYLDYIFTPRIFSQYNNSIIPNTTYIYNSTGQLWASDNASAGAPQTAIVLSNNQIRWRTETIPNGTLRNETTQSVLLDCVRDEEYLGLNTTTQKEWNISVYSILTSVVSTQNLTVWTNYTAYGDITEITYAANLTNSTGTYDITGITILNETLTTLTFPNLTLVANASISIAITGKPKQRPYVKIIYPIGNTFDTNTIVP